MVTDPDPKNILKHQQICFNFCLNCQSLPTVAISKISHGPLDGFE